MIDETRTAITANNELFVRALEQGDVAAIVALYTSDACLLPPNQPMLNGTEAIRNFWQGMLLLNIKQPRLETVEVAEQRDDLACEIGRYSFTVPLPDGQSVTDIGKYLVVWKREGGAWRLHIDIWNTNAPAG
ncbi:MAG TPA: SgcJ/EcaC family oxidoreductase [Pyrinomonadaceae bacterium]|nr:SgcJ/EcaC family oxidoreductase [Pyrinomonadaceae bacterium]